MANLLKMDSIIQPALPAQTFIVGEMSARISEGSAAEGHRTTDGNECPSAAMETTRVALCIRVGVSANPGLDSIG